MGAASAIQHGTNLQVFVGAAWLVLVQQAGLRPGRQRVRNKHLSRFRHYTAEIESVDHRLEKLKAIYPQIEALTVHRGIGTYTAIVIIGEVGDVRRFRRAKEVASYAGLMARVNQSGEHCYYGHISKQGPLWLRWLLIEAARKLAEICWKRLVIWERQHHPKTAVA